LIEGITTNALNALRDIDDNEINALVLSDLRNVWKEDHPCYEFASLKKCPLYAPPYIIPNVNNHHTLVDERVRHAVPLFVQNAERNQRIPLNEANKQPHKVRCTLTNVCMNWSVVAGTVESVIEIVKLSTSGTSRNPSPSSPPSSSAPLSPLIYRLSWPSVDSVASDLDIVVRRFRELDC